MKKIYAFLVATSFAIVSFTQVPEAFNYQAVVRNSFGEVFANKLVDLQIRILQDTALNEVYLEYHQQMTNQFGLVNLLIGGSTNNIGDFSAIDWGNGSTFIEVSIKDDEGDYQLLGTSQLLSVPYALYAKTVENKDDADADPLNELQDIEVTDTFKISLTNSDITYNLKHLLDGVNDADADSTNELISAFYINNTYLVIEEGNNKDSIDLNLIINDADADAENEEIDTVYIDNNKLYIYEGYDGSNQRINIVSLDSFDQRGISILDPDHDPINEIQELVLDTLNNKLSLTLSSDTVDLTKYTYDKQKLYVSSTDSSVSISIENGDTITFSINDNDSSNINELQTLAEVLAEGNDAGGVRITNISSPIDDFDAVTKEYVDYQYGYLGTVFESNMFSNFISGSKPIIYDDLSGRGMLHDTRDGNIYRIQRIGSTWWMAEDLNYSGNTGIGEFHEFNIDHIYGKFYKGDEANSTIDTICPDGWSLPTEADFNTLIGYSYNELKVGGSVGFEFVESGYYSPSPSWSLGYSGFWTSTGDSSNYKVFYVNGSSFNIAYRSISDKYNVRCVKAE